MSLAARLAWAYLPCHADREGRLRDSPFALKMAIFPADAIDMDAVLGELSERRHVLRYLGADGRRYIQIRNFLRYQFPHHRETTSVIPEPEASLGLDPGKARLSPPDPGPGPGPGPGPDQVTDPDPDSSEPLRAPEPVVCTLPLVGQGRTWGVPESLHEKLRAAFPGVNVAAEYRKADAWLTANPTKRKTARGMPKFLNGWMERQQNRGGGMGGNGAGRAAPPSEIDRRP